MATHRPTSLMEPARHARGLYLVALCALVIGCAPQTGPVDPQAQLPPVATPVEAIRETEPVPSTGDAADDPAIWVNPGDPAQSLIIGNDKGGGLDVYGLDGARRQRITTGTLWGNVDVRQAVTVGNATHDVIASYNGGLRLYDVDAASLRLVASTEGGGAIDTGRGEGLCLYRSGTSGALYAMVITIQGRFRQFEITDEDLDGALDASLRREFDVGSEAESCAADDETGALYISQEDVGLWRYGAEPSAGSERTLIDAVLPAGNIAPDAEGIAIVPQDQGKGYVIVSAQNVADYLNSYFVAYARDTGQYVGAFRVVTGAATDGCSRTDGIAALAQGLGPDFPAGMFICQDDANTAPGGSGNQNFKLVPLERILEILAGTSPPPTPPPASGGSFVAAASVNGNRVVHSVAIPAGVQTGDTLVAYLAWNNAATVRTPPAGWSEVAAAGDSSMSARAWATTATGSGGSLAVALSAIAKADLTVAAYRDLDLGSTVARLITTSGSTAATPTAVVDEPVWVVSYWADKSSSNTALSVPDGVLLRSSSLGSSSGRITAALADSGATLPAGAVGGLTATATASHTRAATFTTTLTPRGEEPPAENVAPSAVAAVTCTWLACSYDASASGDSDGNIVDFAWDLGDGTTATGPVAEHAYLLAGTYQVSLTVLDDDGASDAWTQTITVADRPIAGGSFVGAVSVNGNRSVHSAAIPAGVQAGDTLVAYLAWNNAATVRTAPSGWTQVAAVGDSSMAARAWATTATGSGGSVGVTLSAIAKADLTVAAYRDVGLGPTLARLVTSSGATAATPATTVAGSAWVVSYWADKSSSNTGLTVPDGQVLRSSSRGSSSGRITAVLADSGAALPPGPVGGLTATATANHSRAATFTTTLNPRQLEDRPATLPR